MKLLLIDGYSLLFRAYFSSPPLTTRDGRATGALYSFTRMVLRLLDDARPEYALIAFDAHGPTFRHDADATYKAHRPEAPDDLREQLGAVRELMDGLSIPHYEHSGYEADDILGTLARLGSERGLDVTIVTGDGDALQLASEKVSVMLTRRGVSELDCYTPAEVREKFGFDPQLVPDYKGLRGDSSDNIPGVPGIGEKTGQKLIAEFGSLENLYEHLDEVKPERIRKLLEEHRETAFHSRSQARIVCDLAVDTDLETCRWAGWDNAKRAQAASAAAAYEFRSLVHRFSLEESTPDEAAPPAFEAYELKCASDAAELMQWARAESGKSVALLLDVWQDETGQAATPEQQTVMAARGEEVLCFEGNIKELRAWLEDEAASKIVHDAKTVKVALARHGLTLRGVVADTMLMAYLLEPARQSHPLDVVAATHLNKALPDLAALAKERAKIARKTVAASLFDEDGATDDEATQSTPASAEEIESNRDNLAATASALSQLEPVLRAALQEIGEQRLFEELELPLVDVLAAMEEIGMLLDIGRLQELGRELEADAARLEAEIHALAGTPFNIGSTRQIQEVLYDRLELPKGRKLKTGYSTDVHHLERLAEEHEIVRKILEYRGTAKLKSTYVDALLAAYDAQTHRIHTNLNQTGTVSGRISSSNPNLQNIPIRTEQGRRIRRVFIAPPGQLLLKADYSQIELRILAHITGDEPLVEAFRAGQDVHSSTAARLFGVALDAVDAEMRRKAKMTNYAIAYGVSGFGLAKQLGVGTAQEAQAFIEDYFAALPGVKRYMDETLEKARACGYVETLLGRRRPVPEINSRRAQERAAAERVAINHPIQGTAADIMKIAMLAVYHALRERDGQTRMIMQVHDELVFEAPEDELSAIAPLVGRLMRDEPTNRLELSVPLEVDLGAGPNWNDVTREISVD
jgi:DNA polymerase-1